MSVYTFSTFDQTIGTIVTTEPNGPVTREWINAHRNSSIYVGFEVETDIYTARIGTVQFCIGNHCLVIRLGDTSPCAPFLDEFLGDVNRVFIGNHIRCKTDLFKAQFPFTGTMITADLGETVNGPYMRAMKESLILSVAQKPVEFDWDRRLPLQLSHHQVHYASLDAFLNLQIANWFWKLNL